MKQFVFKIIYSPIINPLLRKINKFLSPILPDKIKISPSGVLTLHNGQGKSIKLALNQTNSLGHKIIWNGGYQAFEYVDIFEILIKRVNLFYDIGANIGIYSLIASMENEDIEVVSFEPATGPLHYLKLNKEINNFTNITIAGLALSHGEGEIEFYEIKNKKYKYLEHNLAGEGNAGTLTEGRNFEKNIVKTTTLDSFILKMNHSKPLDLIKIDTEGTEYLILRKGAKVLLEMQPIIICEVLFNAKEKELEETILKYGYLIFVHDGKGLKKIETLVRKKDNGLTNYFFVPPSKLDWVEEFIV